MANADLQAGTGALVTPFGQATGSKRVAGDEYPKPRRLPLRILGLSLLLHLALAGWLGYRHAQPPDRPQTLQLALITHSQPAQLVETPLPPAHTDHQTTRSPSHAARRTQAATPVTPIAIDTPGPVTVAETAQASVPAHHTATPESGLRQEGPISAPRFDPAYLNNPKPPYPLQARRRGIEGKVVLKVQVTTAGHAHTVEMQHSSGNASLDEAALDTVRNWRFVPAMRGETPVAAAVLIPISFKLES